MLPLCFVLMPSGRKTVESGSIVDFDTVYERLIAPAIHGADMEPLRADDDVTAGAIQKPLFERLILCDFAVADITGANANVYYELGLRHGMRPATTVLLYAGTERMPFDVAPMRAIPYRIDASGNPVELETAVDHLKRLLDSARGQQGAPSADSAVFQLVEGHRGSDIARLKTDVFRDRAHYAPHARKRLEVARREGKEAVRQVAGSLGNVDDLEAGVVIDLLLSFRAVGDWQAMLDLVDRMPQPLARSVMVREQLGFALNRLKRRDEAERVLWEVIAKRGANSETNAILGRVYKDRWEEAVAADDAPTADGWLAKAIDAYLRGFEADWRDAYPGINAVTLMEVKNPPDPRRDELLPVVIYAVRRRVANGSPDYWDHATLLELAVLQKDEAAAKQTASNALAAVREKWEPASTARNLASIRKARAARGEDVAWAGAIESTLLKRAQS